MSEIDPKMYPIYLRLLDAEAAGATASEMADVLFPDKPNAGPTSPAQQAVREGLRVAHELRDGGYLRLISHKRGRDNG